MPPSTSRLARFRNFLGYASISFALTCSGLPAANAVQPEQPAHGSLSESRYHFADIGWTMHIPPGWHVQPQADVDKSKAIGKKAIEKATGEHIDDSGLLDLLALTKDRFHVFQSTVERVSLDRIAHWPEDAESVRQVLIQSLRDRGIKEQTTALRDERIDGVDFKVFESSLFTPDGEMFLHIMLFGALIGHYDVGLSVTYQNPADGQAMLKAIRSSTFTPPKN